MVYTVFLFDFCFFYFTKLNYFFTSEKCNTMIEQTLKRKIFFKNDDLIHDRIFHALGRNFYFVRRWMLRSFSRIELQAAAPVPKEGNARVQLNSARRRTYPFRKEPSVETNPNTHAPLRPKKRRAPSTPEGRWPSSKIINLNNK